MARPSPPLKLEPAEARKVAYAGGLRLLAGREMSTARLCERLRARGLPKDAIDDAVDRLLRAGALDDARAARAAARTLVAVKHRGRLRAAREMTRLGFDADVVTRTLDDLLGEVDERAVLRRVVESRLHGRQTIQDAPAYRRMYGALLRRGFAAPLIREALRPYWRGQRPAVAEEVDE